MPASQKAHSIINCHQISSIIGSFIQFFLCAPRRMPYLSANFNYSSSDWPVLYTGPRPLLLAPIKQQKHRFLAFTPKGEQPRISQNLLRKMKFNTNKLVVLFEY